MVLRQVLFYATKDDLLPLLEEIESKGPVMYVRMGHDRDRAYESYSRGREISNLGEATCDSAINCTSFLVCRAGEEIKVRPITLNTGVEVFAVDQLLNPNTVTFSPGGLWKQEVVLHGRVATTSDSKPAQELMRRFQSAIKKSFTKVKAFYVGPQANALLESGKRLTIAVQTPREYDLKP